MLGRRLAGGHQWQQKTDERGTRESDTESVNGGGKKAEHVIV